jgi:pre-rRNA-processing protein TSR4
MPPYDSDSSGDEDDYTETNILLGYATKESTSDTISHLGGYPTWLDDKTQPSGVLSKCKVCNGLLSLLLELNGDLPDQFPGHERRLYILACRRKTCRRKEGSVRGIRGLRVAKGAETAKLKAASSPAPKKDEQKPQNLLGESIFGVKPAGGSGSSPANPFSTLSIGKGLVNPFATSTSKPNPFSAAPSTPQAQEPQKPAEEAITTLPETFASKARISSSNTSPLPPRPHLPWPAESEFPPPFPLYQLDAEYETLDAPSEPAIPENARMDIDEGGASGGGNEEAFESSLDKTFQKFADRVGQNPEQVLRYEFRGQPLLYSKTDAVGKRLAPHADQPTSAKVTTFSGSSGMPRCDNCGAQRVFEVQLTPHAITELEAEEMSIEGMEWGTIILGVCGKDCKPADVAEAQVGYLEEWVGVQWEELAKR